MPRKSYKPEEIVAKLRQVDVLTSQGQSVAEAIRSIGVSEVTYYRWRQEFGGLKSDQVKRLKDLETESTRLRRAVSDLAGQGPNCEVRPLAESQHQTVAFASRPFRSHSPSRERRVSGAVPPGHARYSWVDRGYQDPTICRATHPPCASH
jgi:putative transposase